MKAAARVDDLAVLFQALADPTRLRILGLLTGGEVCVCDIHESLAIPQPKASRHLAYLRKAGLVQTRRSGLWVHYRLANLPGPVFATVTDAVAAALARDPAVRADAARLRKRQACCADDTQPAPVTFHRPRRA